MQNFFGKLKEQATDFIEKNPDQIEGFKHQAADFLKQKVDEETEKEAKKANNSDEPLSKTDQLKAQALGVLKPQLDQFVDAYDNDAAANEGGEGGEADDADEAPSKPPPGKPSYLIPKKDDDAEGEDADATEPSSSSTLDSSTSSEASNKPPPKKKPHGKPSYLIPKKEPEAEEEETYNAAVGGNEEE